MKIGGSYEHQLPRPWTPDWEHMLLKNAIEQVELADRTRNDYVWAREYPRGYSKGALRLMESHRSHQAPTLGSEFCVYSIKVSALVTGPGSPVPVRLHP